VTSASQFITMFVSVGPVTVDVTREFHCSGLSALLVPVPEGKFDGKKRT